MLYNRVHKYQTISDIFSQSRRYLTQPRQLEDLQQLYELLKHESHGIESFFFSIPCNTNDWSPLASVKSYSKMMNPNGIFANNELDLQKIKVYGFDFGLFLHNYTEWRRNLFYLDYTLARYKPTLHSLIYDKAKTFLVKKLRVSSNWQYFEDHLCYISVVSRWFNGFLFSTWYGRTWSSSRY